MELAILENKLAVKDYSEEKLNEVILMHFTPWLGALLSLSGETSVERLKIALPAIKLHAWSLGFDEIKKMFEMYVDNKLGIEPIPNYFDRILFGKIAAAYKAQRPVKKKELAIPEISEAEKKLLTHKGILRTYSEFKENKDVGSGTAWVYEYLDELGVFNFSREDKLKTMRLAKTLEKSEVNINKPGAKNILEMLEEKKSPRVVNRAKRILLNDYFGLITVERLKEILNNG